MPDATADDANLLRQYLGGSEAAFRELVQRHLGMVRGTARRVLTTAPHLADDVAQAVFTNLAKQASILHFDAGLGGWLHSHTYYLALNAVRSEHRRRTRERTAMEIHAVNDESPRDEHWAHLAPVLDEALNQLDAEDRDAIVRRYLGQCDLRAVGAGLGISTDTAQKRITRALEKLRAILTRRGVAVASAGALSSTLEAHMAATTPTDLATAVSTKAINAAATSTIATPKAMPISKIAIGAAIAAGLLVTVIIAQNGSTTKPGIKLPTAKANAAGPTTIGNSAPATASAKVELSKAPPARGDGPTTPGLTDDGASFSPSNNPSSADPADATIASTPFASPQTSRSQAPAAAVAPASQASNNDGYGDGSQRMLTVTDGQLTMTIKYANGTITTTPYKETGATVTITTGDKPDTYDLTFRGENDGKIYTILKGVRTSADYAAGKDK